VAEVVALLAELAQAGAWVLLVVVVGMILVTGARGTWVWGREVTREREATAREREDNAVLRADNEKLRTSLDKNTEALASMSADFVRGLDKSTDAIADQGTDFVRALDQVGGQVSQLSGLVIHELRNPVDDVLRTPAPRGTRRRGA
jgi:hypothetical protein